MSKSLKISEKTHTKLKEYCKKNLYRMMDFVELLINKELDNVKKNHKR